MDDQLIEHFKSSMFCSRVNITDVENIFAKTYIKSWKSGQTIIHHNEHSTTIYVLLIGRVTVTTFTRKGKEVFYERLNPGSFFGEISALDDLPRSTNVICATDATTASLNKADLIKTILRYPLIAMNIINRLIELNRNLNTRIFEFGAYDANERTRAELLRLAHKSTTHDNYSVIENMPTHESIANRVASHREAVTKELNRLHRLGLLKKKGRTIIIPDVNALAATLADGA